MNLHLDGKIAIVSGSSRGIGKAIASKLLEEEALVFITGRNPKTLDMTYQELYTTHRGRVFKFCGDLCETKVIKRLISTVISRHKKLDIVVMNIGSGQYKMGWNINDRTWSDCFEKNLFSAVRLSREAVGVMSANKSGSLIFISSIAGCEATAAPIEYSAAKAALLSYTKNISLLAARYGIRANAISPGNVFFQNGTWDKKARKNKDATERYIKGIVPLQRFGRPEEVADAVSYLSSEKASFISGANLILDGGQVRKFL